MTREERKNLSKADRAILALFKVLQDRNATWAAYDALHLIRQEISPDLDYKR